MHARGLLAWASCWAGLLHARALRWAEWVADGLFIFLNAFLI
jgi:hypothetical protein